VKFNPDDATFPEGLYDCFFIEAVEKSSKSGNPMIDVTCQVFLGNKSQLIHDYFVHDVQGHLTRLNKLCKAIGHDFKSGEITPDQIKGKNCKAYIKVHDDDQYGMQNKISRYEPLESPGAAGVATMPQPQPGSEDVDIPF